MNVGEAGPVSRQEVAFGTMTGATWAGESREMVRHPIDFVVYEPLDLKADEVQHDRLMVRASGALFKTVEEESVFLESFDLLAKAFEESAEAIAGAYVDIMRRYNTDDAVPYEDPNSRRLLQRFKRLRVFIHVILPDGSPKPGPEARLAVVVLLCLVLFDLPVHWLAKLWSAVGDMNQTTRKIAWRPDNVVKKQQFVELLTDLPSLSALFLPPEVHVKTKALRNKDEKNVRRFNCGQFATLVASLAEQLAEDLPLVRVCARLGPDPPNLDGDEETQETDPSIQPARDRTRVTTPFVFPPTHADATEGDMKPATPFAGDLIAGRFVMEQVLGQGSFSKVVGVRDRLLAGGPAALKMAHAKEVKEGSESDGSDNDEGSAKDAAEALLNEVQMLRRLAAKAGEGGARNPFIEPLTVFEYDGHKVMHMRRLRGDLHQLLDETPTFFQTDDDRVANLVRQLLAGLKMLRSIRVIHGDLKSENICYVDNGQSHDYYIMDLGGAVEVPADEDNNKEVQYTLEYVTPEFAAASLILDAPQTMWKLGATDLWGLGHVVFQMVTGRRAFESLRNIDCWQARLALIGKLVGRWEQDPQQPVSVQHRPAVRFSDSYRTSFDKNGAIFDANNYLRLSAWGDAEVDCFNEVETIGAAFNGRPNVLEVVTALLELDWEQRTVERVELCALLATNPPVAATGT